MSTVASQTISSNERPIGLRTRGDLMIEQSVFQGEYCWIVKDPLAMKYFRLREPEFKVLELLRSPTSYRVLRSMLSRAFPEMNTRVDALQQLVHSLHQNGLLVSNSSGQAMPLGKRRKREQTQKTLSTLTSVVSVRFPGWDPERFLNWLYPRCKFMFSTGFTSVVTLTYIAALMLVLTNLAEFRAKLPEFQQFFAVDNILFMACLLIFTKSIHELGHGLMCKHFGGECHQIGFMLLLMTPAMYCDTSDSWILRNRWHRMAIGAGGMYVELFLASVCTFIWWYTNAGWLHYLALNIMFLSSVSTIIFNANPLLRYDGYFILSDFWEIPNLSQKANMTMLSWLRVYCLGMKPMPSHLLPKRNRTLVAIYGFASLVYRWIVMIGIMWFLSKVFEPYGLSAIGHSMIALTLTSLVVMPVYRLTRFLLYPGRLREVSGLRISLSAAVVTAITAIICFVPMPYYVWSSFVIRPQNAQQLVVVEAGSLTQVLVTEGDWIEAGEIIAVLTNHDLDLELEELRGRVARLQADQRAVELSSAVYPDAGQRISELVAEIASLEHQIVVKEQQIAKLTIRAERPGLLFAPPNMPSSPSHETSLEEWHGTPLAKENLGTYVEANSLLGMIGDPSAMEAHLIVDQSDTELLALGQRVVLLPRQLSGQFLAAELTGIASDELTQVPRELSQTHSGPIPVEQTVDGSERPILKSYEAFAMFMTQDDDKTRNRLLPGMSGQAKIHVGSSSIGERLLRYLYTVIRFR